MAAPRRTLFLVCLLVCALVSTCVDATPQGKSVDGREKGDSAASTLERGKYVKDVLTCADDMKRLCSSEKTVTWQCMFENIRDIKRESCRNWVAGLMACDQDAQREEGCIHTKDPYMKEIRRCVRELDEQNKLSEACRKSHFYLDIKHVNLRVIPPMIHKSQVRKQPSETERSSDL